MSEELKVFYKAYAEWLDSGAVNNAEFCRDWGLCACVMYWVNEDDNDELLNEMKSQFASAGLSESFPFNSSENDYVREYRNKTMHLNEARLDWVRKHAEIH